MKSIMIIGPAFSGKSELAKFLNVLEPKATVLNVKNICISKALSSGENPDTITRSFTEEEVRDALGSYLDGFKEGKTVILDGLISDLSQEGLLFSYDFIDHVILIKKDSDIEMFEKLKKQLEDKHKEFTVLEFKDNKLSIPNVFKL